MNEENSKKLHQALSKEYDMGSYDQFVLDIQDEGKRRKLYDAIKDDYDLPDFDGFSQQLGIVKGDASSESDGRGYLLDRMNDAAQDIVQNVTKSTGQTYKGRSSTFDDTMIGDASATAREAAAIASGAPHIVRDGVHGALNVIHNGTDNTTGGRPDLLESLNAYGNLLLLPQRKEMGEKEEVPMPGSTGGGLPSGEKLRKADYTDKDKEEDIKLMNEYLGNDVVDENGNVITGTRVSSRYKPRTVYSGQTRSYKEGLIPESNLDKYVGQAVSQSDGAKWETKDRSGMNYQELVKERQALAGKYPNAIAQANDDVLRDAYELNNIDLEIVARDLGYKSANEMNSHPGKRDAALIGPDLNQQWLDYYKNYGSTVTEYNANPLYVDGWDKLADMVETDQKNGVTRGVDDYIQALFNNNPGLEDKFYAWCMECASRGDVSFNGTVEAALEDYRKSIMAGENRWKLAGDDKKQAVKDVNEQLDEMDAGYEEDLDAWQKRFDEWWDKNGSPFEHHPQELYAAATGDNALSVTRAAQHISADTREMANEALKTKDFMSASVRGIWNKVSDIRNWDLGITELKDNLTIMNVLDKVAEGKQLSDSEQKLMDGLALKQMTAGFFKDYISLGYKTGQVTGEALPFMLQMMSGIGAAGKGAAKGSTKWIAGVVARWAEKYITNKGLPKLFTKAAEKVLGRKFTGVVSKVVNSGTAKKIGKAVGTIADEAIGTAAGGTSLAVTVGAPATAAEAVSNMTRDTKVAMGSDGKPMLIVSKDKKNAGEAIRNAVVNQGIQYGTEMAGEYFKPITDFFGKYIGKGLSKNKIGREILDFVSNMKASDFAKMVDHFRREAHYDGTLGEYLEEVLGNFSNAVLVGDMNFNAPSDENSVFNVKNNWETYVACLYMSGLFGAANLAGYRSPKFRANESLKHADKNARRIFGKDWSTIADIINTGSDDAVQNFMVDLMQSGKYNRYQKQAALDYAGAHYKLRGVEEGETRSELSAGDQEASEAYGRGYNIGNLETIAETSSAYQQLRAQMEQEYGAEFVSKMDEKPGTVYGWLRSGEVNEEDAQKVLGYLNAKMAYDGAVDRINDDQAAAEAASDKHIDDRVNPEKDGGDGMIHPVVLKSGDKQVYVTNGQVVTNEDGTVDTKASTQSIVVVDEEGNVDMINPDAIDHVEDVIDPEQAKQAAREEMAATTQAVAEPEEMLPSIEETIDLAFPNASAEDKAQYVEYYTEHPEELENTRKNLAIMQSPEQAKQTAPSENGTNSQAPIEPEADETDDVESGAVSNYDNVLDAMGIEGEEDRQAWNDYWAENAPEDAMDVLLDAQGVTDPAQRQSSKEYWKQNPRTFNSQWRYTMGDISSQAVNDAIAQGGTSESEADARNTQTPTATAQPQPQPQQQTAPSIAATSLGNYEQDDDVVLNVDGQQITGFISNVTPDGKLRLQLDAPINGNRVIDVTPEELDKMVAQPQASAESDVNAALAAQNGTASTAPAAPAAEPAQPGAATAQPSAPTPQPAQPSQPSLPVGEDGNADFSNATPQEAHDYIYNDPDLDEEEADQVVQNYAAQANEQLAQAQAALDQAEAVPAPVMRDYGTDVAGYKRAKKERNDAIANAQAAVADAQRGVNLWNGVQDMRNANAPAQEAAPDAPSQPAAVPAEETAPTAPSAPQGGETRMSSTESVDNQEQPATAERSEEEMTPDERIEQAIKERINMRAKEIAEACGMPSHVIENIDDPSLPDSYRRKIKELEQKGEMVEGWYDTDTGHMYFYLPGIPNLDRLDEIYAHETVAHGGLRLLLRGKDGSDEDFHKLCDKVWHQMSEPRRKYYMRYVVAKHVSPEDWKDVKKRQAAIDEGMKNQQYQREAADEYMAKLSEEYEKYKRNQKERGIILKVIDFIRDAIKKHFNKEDIKLKVTSNRSDAIKRQLKKRGIEINIETDDPVEIFDILERNGIHEDVSLIEQSDILNLLDESRRNLTEMDAVAVSNQIDNALSNGEQKGANAANGIFSTTSIFEGAGFEVQQIDAEGNSVPMVDSKGNMIVKIGDQEFSAEHPVTVEDLKPKKVGRAVQETSVLQMLVEDAKNLNGLSEKKADKIYQNYADILNMYLYMGSAEMGGPDAVERNWEWLGDTVFRTIAANGDAQYSYSMDIIRVCKKNEAVIKAMSAHQLLSGRGATPSEIVDIYRKTYVEGFQVPCPVCYVFTRYIRNGKYASAAIRGMETYGEHLPGGNDVWTAKQWADELDRLNRLKNSKYEVKGKETEAQKEKRVAEAKRFEKALEKANEITVKYEKRLNALSVVLTSPGLTAERERKILDEIKAMDAQYQGAIDVISYQALTNWIKTHAIEEKKGSGWKLRDDAQKPADINDYKANALDLRLTANTIVNYPAIQRLRKSGGSAAGKEISFASNNELGEIVSGLGINKTNLSTYANPYQMALNTDLDQKKRKEWRRKARERFKDASTYAAMQTLRGGQRMWSWSDNIERLSPDVAINLIQLELLNGAMQTYSKQLEGVKLAAQMGAYVNGSLMAKDNGWLEVEQDDVMERDGQLWLNHDITDVVDEPQVGGGTEKRERVIAGAGSHVLRTTDGKLVVLQFDDIIGIDPYGNREVIGKDGKKKKAKGLFELNNELDKAGNILVGMNDLHIRAALADPRVFFVIPWHSSGANNHILAEMFAILEQRIDNSVDYTDMQEEKNMGTRNKDTKELPEVIQKLRDLWEEGRQWAKENKWASGLEVDSNGDVMTESQYMYRQLRSLIFSGEIFKKMPTNAEYKKAVADAKAYNARLDEIQADLDRGGLTAEQKKALEKERDKIRPKRNEAQGIVDRHDGLIDWRDSAVHKDDAAWNAEHPKRINVEEARKMILADEFLKQVYNRVKPIGKMTNGDNTYIYPYEYWDESSTYDTADINGKRYVEYCRRMGYKPKFAGNWKTKDVSKQGDGNFVHDPGYWKLLIDRRMYDREGNYQWLDPVTSEDFNTDLINPMETQHEFHVTTVADDAAADSIASKVFEEESKTPGGFAHANYDKPLDKVVGDFEKVMFSTSVTPTFYSNAERAVENIKQNKATAEQWLAMIKKNGGLKAGEDKWMGLSQWLEDNKGKSLTKDEVLQFVRDNSIQMEEVEYGDVTDAPGFAKLNKEYLELLNNTDKLYQEAAKRFADYVGKMEEKYGDDYFDKWTNQEKTIYTHLSLDQEDKDPTWNSDAAIAMQEMQNRHGDDFGLSFDGTDFGLQISDSDAASYFVGDVQGINSTRLDYTTKGLENKREIAFVVPNVESYQENDEVHFGPENQGKAVMWVRFGETTDADGKRVLVIDEIQSNRHQDAREKGYNGDTFTAVLNDEGRWDILRNGEKVNEQYYREGQTAEEIASGYAKYYGGTVPSAPFEKNWHEVAMKRMLRLAAEEGFDKVAWTTGEQQAKRYSLGRAFDSIEREDNPNMRDRKRFVLSGSNMETVEVNNEGMVVGSTLTDAIGKDLREVVGQSVAEKMMGLEDGDMLEGEDLRIGGEGMKGFYDNMLPRFMDKYGKRWGVKTGTVELPNVEEAGRTMHSVDVTPEMKESVMQGQMLFSTNRVDNAADGTEVEVDGVPAYEANNLLFSVLDPERDAELIAELDGQEYVTVYRTMAKVNGEYYPPMDSRDHDNPEKLRNPEKLEQYTQSEERPDLAYPEEYIDKNTGEKKTRWKFNLKKSNGKSVDGVAYNPYMHTSDSALNDQFSEAQDRDDLVVVECRVPVSELDPNSYHAEKALDPVGWKPWKAGPIVSKMTGKRNLLLSRWVKPVKELSWSEVADMVSKQLGDQFDVLPSNTFSKGLRAELEKRGYQFIETDNKGIIKNGLYKGVTWSDRYYDIHPELDKRNNKKQKRAKVAEAKARNAEAGEGVMFSTSAAVDALRDDERVYNDLLGKVFSGVSNETRRGIVEDAMRNRGYDFGAATEAWLSGLADDETFAQLPQEDWRAVKNALSNALRDNGVEGEMTDNEARYVLWRAGQIEDGMFSQAKDIVMQDELGLSNAQSTPGGVRFSTSPAEQIYSDNFKNWFGDWENDPENASKVVDENGRPKVVYHQTNRTQFINKKTGQNWDDLDWRERDEWDNRSDEEWEDTWEEQDFYTFDNRYGRQSIEYPAFFFAPEEDPYHEYGKRTIAVYLDIKNPAIDPVIPDAGVSNTAGRDAMQALIDQGYDGVIRTEDGVPYEYIAFYPNQIKSATENNGDFSRENPDIRFSMSPRDRSIARDQYERWMSNSRMQWSEAMQDSMLGLKKLMQAIVGKQYKYIEDIPMNENPYVAENLMSSVTAAEQAAFYTEFMKPLMKAVGKLCKGRRKDRERKRQELTDYLMAKHGLERNLVFADRDAQETAAAGGNYQDAYNENRERDYAGLTALTDESDVHAAEAAAQQIVANYEAQHDVTELWEKINAATKATLEKQYQSGILSKASYEKIRDMFEYYVPLRGWDETTSDEVYGYLTSNAGPFLGGSIVKHAEGRTSKADDPIATISMMADDSIRTGNRNLMKQKFLNFVLNHPSDAVSVNELWLQYDDVKREWVPVFADIPADATAEEVEQIVAQFEQDMAQLAQQQPGKYKHGHETANIPYKVIPGNEREHQVLVKRRGQTYVLTINGNPRAAQALNGLTNPDVNIEGAWGSIIKGSEWVNRMLSALYTTLSPAFIVSNFLRDSFYSNNMVWVKEKGSWKLSKNYPLRFNYNYYKTNPAVLRWLLGKWENGTLDESKPIQKMFKEFMLHGGETGFAMAQDINDYKKKVYKELNGMNGRNYLKKAGSIVAEQYDLLGRSIENCARFAAFMTSRQMGRSVERAAFDAKEISVNFNKKGSGGKMLNQVGQTKAGNWGAFISGLARSAYTFWNAGVQGMANISRATKRNPFKAVAGLFTKWFGYGFFAPMLAAAMGAAAGGDDDDKNAYYNLPEYVRRSNICIWLGDAWLTLPLPIEFRAIYGLGELTYGVWSGNERYNNEELAMQYASQFSQVLPIDMLEGGGGWHPFIPTLLKPIVESEQNVSWSGIPIYKDSPYNQSDPDWTKAFSNTSGWLVASSEWLNAKTGGDEYKKGWLDLNPSKIEYLLKGYLGGLYSFPNDVMKAIQTATGDQEFEWRNIPLANRVIKEGDERLEAKKLRSDYFRYKEEYEETKRLLDKYEKAVKDGNSLYDYAKKLDILNNSKEYAHYEIFKNMDASMAPFREAAGKAEDPEVVKQYEAMELKLMREMVDMINAYDDGKAVDPETAMRKVLMEVLDTATDEALKLEASKELAKSHGAKDGLGGSDTKYNQRYVALRNGTDVDEDAELQKARRNAKDLGNDALYKAYDRALDELATMRKGIHNKKKTVLGLGEGDADSDARIMDKIRTRRREVLDMSDEEVLEKFKPKK